MGNSDAVTVVEQFLDAFDRADLDGMRALLSDDLRAFITEPDGTSRPVVGAEPFLAGIEAMDLPSAAFQVSLTQAPVVVSDDLVLVMVEVRASRAGRSLHNFAAHLLQVRAGRIAEFRMVEAKPAESDAFWA